LVLLIAVQINFAEEGKTFPFDLIGKINSLLLNIIILFQDALIRTRSYSDDEV
jgi:hypothetical protein